MDLGPPSPKKKIIIKKNVILNKYTNKIGNKWSRIPKILKGEVEYLYPKVQDEDIEHRMYDVGHM